MNHKKNKKSVISGLGRLNLFHGILLNVAFLEYICEIIFDGSRFYLFW